MKRWHVREWTTVAGEDAATPIGPKAGSAGMKTVKDSLKPVSGTAPSRDEAAVLRMRRARSSVENAAKYIQHATTKVFPALRAIEGHRGAYLLRRAVDDAIELVVLTLWESMAAIRKFAGVKPEKAVIEPEAKAILTNFDESVTHFEVIHYTEEAAR